MGTLTRKEKASTEKEQAPTTIAVIYPDWAAAFQAYYSSATTSMPPPGYFHSTMALNPQPHPYMRGVQPLMPLYGTPPPLYASLYAHGGMYGMPLGAHPYGPYGISPPGFINEAAAGASTGITEAITKLSEAKEQTPPKRSKESLGSLSMLTGKLSETCKTIPCSANSVSSQSSESGSEGSSEGCDDNSQNGSHTEQKISFGQGCMDSTMVHMVNTKTHSQGGSGHAASGGKATNMSANQVMAAVPISVTGKSTTVTGLTINLNIGMEYWSVSAPTPISTICGRCPGGPMTAELVPSSQNMSLIGHPDSLPTELWLQDERELKKQRRKQSNRESARRSRLRKQAECEELAERVGTLKAENVVLRTEIYRLEEEQKKLKSINASLHDLFSKAQREENRDGT